MACATSGFCLVFAEKAVYFEDEFAIVGGIVLKQVWVHVLGEWVRTAESQLSRSSYCLSVEGEWSQLC